MDANQLNIKIIYRKSIRIYYFLSEDILLIFNLNYNVIPYSFFTTIGLNKQYSTQRQYSSTDSNFFFIVLIDKEQK